MTNIFLCIMFACMFAQYFYINFNVQILDSAVDNFPIALIEAWVDLTGNRPYYMEEQLEEAIDDYYSGKLTERFNYKVVCNFYTNDASIEYCDGDCTGVEITLTSEFSVFYTYSRTMHYDLVEGLVS